MKHLFPKLQDNAAQHTVEYMTVIILIMAGIIIGGPYVIRSWNAQMKSWDDSVTDSLQDPLAEAPAISIQGCDPGSWDTVACGVGQVDPCTGVQLSCEETEMLSSRLFDPDGCQCSTIPPQETVKCDYSDCCCTTPVSTGYCGVQDTSLTNPRTSCSAPVPDEVSLNGDGSCPDGYMKNWVLCGTDPNRRYICIQDDACVFNCTGTLLTGIAYEGLCSGDSAGLTGDTPYTYVNICADSQKCQVRCKFPPFMTYGPYCDCPPDHVVYSNTCALTKTFTVATEIDSGKNTTTTNDQSTFLCGAQYLVISVSVSGTGCSDPGTPGSSCVAELRPWW